MSKFIVTIGDDTHEVDSDAIKPPKGYVLQTQETLDAVIEARLSRQKAELARDEEFAASVLRTKGVPVGEDGKYAPPKPGKDFDEAAERERIKNAIIAEEVAPLRGQIESAEDRIARLLAKSKRAELLQAAHDKGVEDWALKPVVDGGPTMLENMLAPLLEHDPQHDMFAVVERREADGSPVFAPATKQGKPWAGVGDLFDRLSKQDAYRHLFRDTRQQGTGFQHNGGAQPQGISLKALEDGTLSAEQLEQVASGKLRVAG